MFLDHPLGAGYRGNAVLSPQYVPGEFLTNGLRSAHNTFMAMLVDFGMPGAIAYIAIVLWAIVVLRGAKRLDSKGLDEPLGLYRAALGSALAACFVSGQFTNLLTAEVNVWLIALLVVVKDVSQRSVAERSSLDGETATEAGGFQSFGHAAPVSSHGG